MVARARHRFLCGVASRLSDEVKGEWFPVFRLSEEAAVAFGVRGKDGGLGEFRGVLMMMAREGYIERRMGPPGLDVRTIAPVARVTEYGRMIASLFSPVEPSLCRNARDGSVLLQDEVKGVLLESLTELFLEEKEKIRDLPIRAADVLFLLFRDWNIGKPRPGPITERIFFRRVCERYRLLPEHTSAYRSFGDVLDFLSSREMLRRHQRDERGGSHRTRLLEPTEQGVTFVRELSPQEILRIFDVRSF